MMMSKIDRSKKQPISIFTLNVVHKHSLAQSLKNITRKHPGNLEISSCRWWRMSCATSAIECFHFSLSIFAILHTSYLLLLTTLQLNPGTMGFYRVNYSTEMLDLLLSGIRNQELPPRDRLGLESDLFALVSWVGQCYYGSTLTCL